VTTNPEFTDAFLLWFQDEQGTVRLVRFHMPSRQLVSTARRIPRS
jgi:hypothetical protein